MLRNCMRKTARFSLGSNQMDKKMLIYSICPRISPNIPNLHYLYFLQQHVSPFILFIYNPLSCVCVSRCATTTFLQSAIE